MTHTPHLEAVPFRVHASGSLGNANDTKAQIIPVTTEKDWQQLRKLYELKDVVGIDKDFLDKSSVFLIIAGLKGSNGHEVVVAQVRRRKDPERLTLEIRELRPKDVADPVITYPYVLLSIDKKDSSAVIECMDANQEKWQVDIHRSFRMP